MIKRQYFIAGTALKNDNSQTLFFRQFFHGSLFPQPRAALEKIQEVVAKDINVKITELAVTSFNRC